MSNPVVEISTESSAPPPGAAQIILSPSQQITTTESIPPIPRVCYDPDQTCYWIEDDRGAWITINETALKRELKIMRFSPVTPDGHFISPLDLEVSRIQKSQNISYAGPIAGYPIGLHEEGVGSHAQRFLVTREATLIEPKQGTWRTLMTVLRNVLVDDDQIMHFLGWVQVGYKTLNAGERNPGQALFLIGPAECGKSLIQDLITQILGGRQAKPWKYMTGMTNFNGDLVGAEHLRIGDEIPQFGLQARKCLGERIKNICVEPVQHIEAKYRQAIVLSPFWRITGSLNDEVETLQSMPLLDEHTLEKLILLKCAKNKMPMPTATPEQREAFWAKLVEELPAFLYDLLNEFKIPSDLVSQRYGIIRYHNPEILRLVQTLEPEEKLLDMIDEILFRAGRNTWVGSATELERELKDELSPCREEARKLLYGSQSTSRYLGRLAKRTNPRVFPERESEKRYWRIEASEEQKMTRVTPKTETPPYIMYN